MRWLPWKSLGVRGQPHYEAYLAIGSRSVATEDKIRLAFIRNLLSTGQRHRSQTGVIINTAGDAQRINLAKLMAYLEPVIDTLKVWGEPLLQRPLHPYS